MIWKKKRASTSHQCCFSFGAQVSRAPALGLASEWPPEQSPWLLSLWYFTTKLVTALDSALVRLNLHRHRHLLCRTDSRNRCRSRRRNWQSPCRIASLYTCSLRHSQRYTCAGSTCNCPMLAPGGSVRGERANFTRLVLGCIEDNFCR